VLSFETNVLQTWEKFEPSVSRCCSLLQRVHERRRVGAIAHSEFLPPFMKRLF